MTPETWIDILPALPLARGVAVRSLRGVQVGSFPAGVVLRPRQTDRERVAVAWLAGDSSLRPHDTLRVDLDDPGGFGYALTVWWQQRGTDAFELLRHVHSRTRWEPMTAIFRNAETGMLALSLRHLRGQTTDADRLALARAIAEVSR